MRLHSNKLIILLVLFLLIIGFFIFKAHELTSKVFIKNDSTVQGDTQSISNDLSNNIPFNVLLLGYGGGNHDGPYLTDSIMVVHVDPKIKKVFLVSIPRDIWIKIPTDGNNGSYWKINTAYSIGLDDTNYPNKLSQFKGTDGGGHLAEYIMSQVTGLPIHNFVGLDFNGFKNTIDTLGGVDVNVQIAFDDYQYPIDGKENDLCGHSPSDLPKLLQEATQSAIEDIFPCRYDHLHFNKGIQHMDGATALAYVRSRHSLQDGTDFGRAARQRNLMVAAKQKILSIGFIPKILPFVSSLGDDLRTDMATSDLTALIQHSSDLSKYQIISLALTDQNFLKDTYSSDGQAILAPKDGLGNWGSVHNWLTDTIKGKAQPVPAIIEVENGTSIPGLAQIAVNRLRDNSLQVLDPTDASSKDVQTTTITVYGQNVNISDMHVIEKEFSINTISYSKSTQAGYNVLVIVGNDYNQKQGKKVLNEP